MKIFAIGDLHLALDPRLEKPMDIFGEGWIGHTERLYQNWNETVGKDDVVILCGDISWALKPDEALADLAWIHALPGRKLFFKGNHDLWWTSVNKLNRLYEDGTMRFLQCDAQILEIPTEGVSACQTEPCAQSGPDHADRQSITERGIESQGRRAVKRLAICGSRGWICPGTDGFTAHDRKIYDREVLRLKMSLDDAKRQGADEMLAVLHFPPTNDMHQNSEFTKLLENYGVKKCIYGHLHGKDNFRRGLQGVKNGVEYSLVSLDYLQAKPKEVYK